MRKQLVRNNAVVLALFGLLLLFAYFLVPLQTRMRLTELDRGECFNRDKLIEFGRSPNWEPRGLKLEEYICAPWKLNVYCGIGLGVLLTLSNLISLRRKN